jgi:hypothetical protein
MIRHTTLAIAAVVIVASSAMTTDASARHVGHWHHGWRAAPWGVVAPALIGLAAAPLFWGPPAYAYDYGYGCYIRRDRVLTPWGWRWRRVKECY